MLRYRRTLPPIIPISASATTPTCPPACCTTSASINKEHHTILERLSEHLASGAVVPVIDRTVDLEHVPDASRDLAAGRIAGEAAVVIRSG